MNFKTTLFGLLFTFIAISTQAQEDTRLGAFLAYGTEIENLGIGVNAEFPIAEKITLSPSFIYYLPKEEFGVDLNWFEVNANANYYFFQENNIDLYALGGLNYSNIKVSFDDPMLGDLSSSDGEFGLNLGAGINLDIGSNITPFAELKYVLIDQSQLVAMAGIKFNL